MVQFFINKVREWRRLMCGHEPIITIEISKSALLHNLHALTVLAPAWRIAPVLKSNAYGHGLKLVAGILQKEKIITFFVVDSYFEAKLLRNAGITTSLLVIGYTPTSTIQKNRLKNIYFMVGSLEQLETLITSKTHQAIHLKFDTGMHRQGIPYTQLDEIICFLSRNTTIRIEGVMSHFAEADNPDPKFTKQQIERWNKLAQKLQKKFPFIFYYHLANSAGFAYEKNIIANVGRPGLALYGINPGNLSIKLKPILRMNTIISEVRTIMPGESVGYARAFTAQNKMRIATVPVGYFEGIDRRLSNQGIFLINGKTAPLVGRVSMNISSCDITNIANASIGSSVNIISHRSEDQNSIKNISRLCNTIPYEILAHLPTHLQRVVVESFD